jgi:hypothetical protein
VVGVCALPNSVVLAGWLAGWLFKIFKRAFENSPPNRLPNHPLLPPALHLTNLTVIRLNFPSRNGLFHLRHHTKSNP